MMKDNTRLIHTGRKTASSPKTVNTPVYRASTILHPTMDALEDSKQEYTYGRRGTPSTRGLEESICALEGGEQTLLTPSGLSACTAALMATLSSGDHLMMIDSVYGPTRAFCHGPLARFGVETSYFSPTVTAEAFEAQIRPNTKVVFLEAPGSGTFEMPDVPALTAVSKSRGLVVIMDNTWATPLFFKPLAHGVDVSILAATKYIVGHADVLMGTITSNGRLAARLLDFHGRFGLSVSGDDAYLAQRGLRTLGARLAQHQASGLRLARWLEQRTEIERVLYPALAGDHGFDIWRRDYSGATGLFSVELKPVSRAAVASFLNGLSLFGMGWSWGGFESLAVTVQLTRTSPGYLPIGPLLRFHIGLEDPEDLISDLESGFDRLARANRP